MANETKKSETAPTLAPAPYKPHLFEKQKGWFTFADVYDRFANDIPEGGTFVEIGFYCGRSFLYFLEKIKSINKKANCITVDPFIKDTAFGNYNFEEAKNLIESSGFFAQLAEGKSQEISHLFETNQIDVLFIDGDHSYAAVKKDLELYYAKVKQGGWIGLHDYYNINDVSRAIDEFVAKHVAGAPNKVYVHYERTYLGGKSEPNNAENIGTFYWKKP